MAETPPEQARIVVAERQKMSLAATGLLSRRAEWGNLRISNDPSYWNRWYYCPSLDARKHRRGFHAIKNQYGRWRLSGESAPCYLTYGWLPLRQKHVSPNTYIATGSLFL